MKAIDRALSRRRTRQELAAAEKELARLRADYSSGSFSGHPEEMLESIEHAEHNARQLASVVARRRVVDHDEVKAAREAFNEFHERWYKAPVPHDTGEYWAEFHRHDARLKAALEGTAG